MNNELFKLIASNCKEDYEILLSLANDEASVLEIMWIINMYAYYSEDFSHDDKDYYSDLYYPLKETYMDNPDARSFIDTTEDVFSDIMGNHEVKRVEWETIINESTYGDM